jgi:low temperature requirement protein LtrA
MHEAESRPRWIVRMSPRSPDEPHRVATPLELFFDLVFVVAIAQASAALHHGIAAGHADSALVNFGLAFFGIWWA